MPNVKLPDGRIVKFPDTMSKQEIQSAITRDIMPQLAVQQAKRQAPALTPAPDYTPPQGDYDFSAMEMMRNIPSSTWEGLKGMGQAIAHPIQTAKGMGALMAGTGANIAEMLDPKAAEILRQESPEWAARESMAEQAGGMLKERYGGLQEIQRTAETDPFGTLMDVVGLATLGGGGLGMAGQLPKVGKLGAAQRAAKAGQAVSRAAQAVEPINLARNILKAPAKAIGAVARAKEMPQTMMQNVLKPTTTVKKNVMASRVQTMIDEKLPPTEAGLDKLQSKIWELQTQVDDIIDTAATADKRTVNTEQIVSVLDDLKKDYKGFPKERKMIDARKAEILDDFGPTMPIDEAQKLKKNIYKLNKASYDKALRVETRADIPKTASDKAVARAIMQEIEKLYPEVGKLNRRTGALLDLEKDLTRAVTRIGNRNIIDLPSLLTGTLGGQIGGAKGAMVFGTLRGLFGHPRIQAKLAHVLNEAGTSPLARQQLTQALFQTGRIDREKENE
jgi:hypothetical protein